VVLLGYVEPPSSLDADRMSQLGMRGRADDEKGARLRAHGSTLFRSPAGRRALPRRPTRDRLLPDHRVVMTNRDQLLRRPGKVEFPWRDLFAVVCRVWHGERRRGH
jgi:hypothetical protein